MNRSPGVPRSIQLNGRRVAYRIVRTATAKRCRIRVRPASVEVALPRGIDESRAASFLRENAPWVLEQVAFMERLGTIRTRERTSASESLLLRGRAVPLEVIREPSRRTYAITEYDGDRVRIRVPQNRRVDAHVRSKPGFVARRVRILLDEFKNGLQKCA